MQDGFTHDTSRWPLVVVNVPRRAITDAELEGFIDAQRAMLRRGERYVEIADTTDVYMFAPRQRQRMAEFLKETNGPASRLCAGLGLVITNPLARGGLTAILWFFKPAYPIEVKGTFREAAEFVRGAAASAGLELTPSARDYLLGGPAKRSA